MYCVFKALRFHFSLPHNVSDLLAATEWSSRFFSFSLLPCSLISLSSSSNFLIIILGSDLTEGIKGECSVWGLLHFLFLLISLFFEPLGLALENSRCGIPVCLGSQAFL